MTLSVVEGLPSLRRAEFRLELLEVFAQGCERFGMRVVHWSVQSNHMHLIVEADDREALSRGMQGLKIRLAKRINRVLGRKGTVFADRYHAVALTSPTQVRHAICYVLNNRYRHGLRPTRPTLDRSSSGAWFDGWKEQPVVHGIDAIPAPVAPPRSWLLTTGWRKRGRIGLAEPPEVPRLFAPT